MLTTENTPNMSSRSYANEEKISVKFKYDWHINAHSLIKLKNSAKINGDDFICSPKFGPNKLLQSILFVLKIKYSKCSANEHYKNDGYVIDLILSDLNKEISFVDMKYKMILNGPWTELVSKMDNYIGFGFDDSIQVESGLREEVTSIMCEIDLEIPFKIELKALAEDIAFFRLNSDLTDVTLVLGEKEYPAHKAILAARSTLFAAMFRNEQIVGSKSNRVVIANIEPNVFEALLDFIYTGKCKQLDDFKLLDAAHKYNIRSLMEVCAETMMKTVTKANVLLYLILAKKYNFTGLKNKAIDVINQNEDEVTNREDFIKYIKPDNLLMHDLYLDLQRKYLKLRGGD